MKRKLLFAVVTLFAAVFGGGGTLSAEGYTISDLTSAGWTKITSISQSEIADNYYLVTDASGLFMLGLQDGASQGNRALYYQNMANPATDLSKVWYLEVNGSNYAMRNIEYCYLQLQTEWGNGSSDIHWRTHDQPTSCEWTTLKLNYSTSDNAWEMSTKYDEYLGIYNNGTGDVDAGTEIGANNVANKKLFQIYSISRSAFASLVASGAASASPKSLTSLIFNHDFATNRDLGWTVSTKTGGNYNFNGAVEAWHYGNFDIHQVLSLPNGKYRLTVQASIESASPVAYLYANEKQTPITTKLDDGNFGQIKDAMASDATHGLYAVDVAVKDGTLTVGLSDADNGSSWLVFDNFNLYYYGPTISSTAVALPVSGDMAAETWYYFDVAIAGDNYNATATTLDNIVYTTEELILIEDAASVTAKFTAANNSLSATRYYVKSTTANHLEVAPASYTYTVGDATLNAANGDYIQSNTLTLTYSSAATNDPTGVFQILDASKITVNDVAATAAINADTKVLTITLADPLANGANYAVSVAAGAVGYNAEYANAAIGLTLRTPAVFDGRFYIATTDGTEFISRGGDSNTEAVLDKYGIAADFTTDANNVTHVHFVDNNLYLFGSSQTIYTNKSLVEAGTTADWTVAPITGGYSFKCTGKEREKEEYITVGNGLGSGKRAATYSDDAYAWKLVTPTAHAATIAAYKDANAADVATSASLSATTATALKAIIEGDGWVAENIDLNNSYSSVGEKYQGFGDVIAKQPLTGLENGIYKVSLSIFNRMTWNGGAYDFYNDNVDGSVAYLYAGSNQLPLPSVMSEYATTAYTEGDNPNYSNGGKNYPNSKGAAGQAFDAGKYKLEVFAYVSDGTLDVGVYAPANYANGNWICYRDLKVTHYGIMASDAEKTALADAITAAEANTLGFEIGECAPYKNVAALEALAAAKAIVPATATGVAVVAATTALTGATWIPNAAEVNAFNDGDFSECAEDNASPLDYTPAGWTESVNMRMMLKNTTTYPGLADASATTALMSWSAGVTYGEKTGYTMPLKAGSYYLLTLKASGWNNETRSGIMVSVLNAEDGLAATNLGTPDRDIKGNETNTAGMTTYKYIFKTGAAGNYVFHVQSGNNFVLSDLSLFKTTAVTIDEDVTYDNTLAGTVDVTLNRTIKANYNSIVLPFSMTQAKVEETFGDGSKVYIIGDYADESITFAEQSGIVANKPCILLATEASAAPYALTGCTLVAGTPTDNSVANIEFVGSYAVTSPITKDDDNYVLSNGKLYLVDSDGVTMKGTRAYFHLTTPSPIKALNVFFEDEEGGATAIANINSKKAADGTTFNMAGQRVGADYKGIVIKNGKKVLVK